MIVIDEISFASQAIILHPETTNPCTNGSGVFAGDFTQLQPVQGTPTLLSNTVYDNYSNAK